MRASLVACAEHWPWSSVRAHVAGADDQLATMRPVLDRIPCFAELLLEDRDEAFAVGGILCCSPFALPIFAAHSLLLLRIATLCFRLSSGFFIANVFSSLYDFTARNNFGFATGFLNMIGGLGAGIAILLAGILKNSWGITGLMLWSSLCTAAAAFALLFVSHRRPKQNRGTASQTSR